ncbi:unnamed protein product, partial [Didymodactylos carnosus]
GPDLGCTWSLDVFPLDGRAIPWIGRPTGITVFGLYDQAQGSTVHWPKVNTVEQWGSGTGKFVVGITGSWLGSTDMDCRAFQARFGDIFQFWLCPTRVIVVSGSGDV